MTTQQTTANDSEGRALYHAGQPYDAIPQALRSGWKAAATETADKLRRERLKLRPDLRDSWDKEI
jgi:hypothetical protein